MEKYKYTIDRDFFKSKIGEDELITFWNKDLAVGTQYNISKLYRLLMDNKNTIILKHLKSVNKDALIRFRDLCNTVIEENDESLSI